MKSKPPKGHVIQCYVHLWNSQTSASLGECSTLRDGNIPTIHMGRTILVSSSLIPRVQESALGDVIFSDHSSVILHLSDVYPKGSDNLLKFPAYMATNIAF